MKKERIKNNKAAGIGFNGIIVIFIFLTTLMVILDMSIVSFAKERAIAAVQSAQKYALTKSVDVDKVKEGRLTLNREECLDIYKRQVRENLKVGGLIKDILYDDNLIQIEENEYEAYIISYIRFKPFRFYKTDQLKGDNKSLEDNLKKSKDKYIKTRVKTSIYLYK